MLVLCVSKPMDSHWTTAKPGARQVLANVMNYVECRREHDEGHPATCLYLHRTD